MKEHERLLLANEAWAEDQREHDLHYFDHLAEGQSPQFLWIGCADSRVPAETITGAQPGEIFVQRNVANLVVHTDMNLLSVLQYGVEVLKVKHVIVCGHYGCGGVKSAMGHTDLGLINKLLRNIKDVYTHHEDELNALDDDARFDRLVELNVREQVYNLAKTSIIQSAWHHEQRPTLHGWVFNLHTGRLKEIATMNECSPLDPIYRYDFSTGSVRFGT